MDWLAGCIRGTLDLSQHRAAPLTDGNEIMRYVKGERADTSGTVLRFAVRDTERTVGDVRLFATREERDEAHAAYLSGERPWDGSLTSDEHGGNWSVPPVWEAPTPTEELVTFILTERNEARRMLALEQENRRVEREELSTRLQTALADPITDVNDPRLQPIWDRAAEAAESAGFCSEYERLCDELGIPGRERTYRGVVTISFNAYGYVTARGEDAATDELESQYRSLLLEALPNSYGEGGFSSVEIESIDVDDVSVY